MSPADVLTPLGVTLFRGPRSFLSSSFGQPFGQRAMR